MMGRQGLDQVMNGNIDKRGGRALDAYTLNRKRRVGKLLSAFVVSHDDERVCIYRVIG